MNKPRLEVVRFDTPDVIATSGLGMKLSGFENRVLYDGNIQFTGGSGEPVYPSTTDENTLLAAFKSYFNNSWNSLDQVYLVFPEGFGNMWGLVNDDNDKITQDSYGSDSVIGVNGRYKYNSNDGWFEWYSSN